MATFETYEAYEHLTPEQIAQVLQVKLGPTYRLKSPAIDRIEADNGTEHVFKVMVSVPFGSALELEKGDHFMFFVSRLTGKDMNDWLEAAEKKIRSYAAHRREAGLKF